MNRIVKSQINFIITLIEFKLVNQIFLKVLVFQKSNKYDYIFSMRSQKNKFSLERYFQVYLLI